MCLRHGPRLCHGLMIATLQLYIDALRNELQQYGEMLALLETRDQQECGQSSGSLLSLAHEIEMQIAIVDAVRTRRSSSQTQLAWALGSPEHDSVEQILPALPEEYRPLVTALVDEIHGLIQRLQDSAKISCSQLHRSMELMQRFIAGISPQAKSASLAGEEDSSGADSGPSLAAI